LAFQSRAGIEKHSVPAVRRHGACGQVAWCMAEGLAANAQCQRSLSGTEGVCGMTWVVAPDTLTRYRRDRSWTRMLSKSSAKPSGSSGQQAGTCKNKWRWTSWRASQASLAHASNPARRSSNSSPTTASTSGTCAGNPLQRRSSAGSLYRRTGRARSAHIPAPPRPPRRWLAPTAG